MGKHVTKPPKRLSVLGPNSKYRDNCTDGRGFPRAGKKYWQGHHVLSLTCMGTRADYYPTGDELYDYIEDCLYCADWDINDSPNMLGLPTNQQYRKSKGLIPVNLPSHQVDHNTSDGYTSEVSTWLKDNLWTTLTAKKKIHDVDVKKVEKALGDCSDHFKTLLTVEYPSRPKPNGGTVAGWTNRFDPAWKKKWYKPFSMAKNASERSPGRSLTNLLEIFKKIA